MSATYPGLPSYVRVDSDVDLDYKDAAYNHLVKGEVQREAKAFLLWVVENRGTDNLSAIFEELRAKDPGLGQAVPKFQAPGHFFYATVSLALLNDVKTILPAVDLADHQWITNYLKVWASAVAMDMPSLLTKKGSLPLSKFCDLYDVEVSDLALKVVADDCVAGYQVIAQESMDEIEQALAQYPYDFLTAIRCHIGHEPCVISPNEMRHRFENQMRALVDEDAGLINPKKPTILKPGEGFRCENMGSFDHKIRVFPEYLALLRNHPIESAQTFGTDVSLIENMDSDRIKIINQVMDDFDLAGVARVDLLMAGIMTFPGYGKEKYLALSPEYRQSIYPQVLVDSLAHVADNLRVTSNPLAYRDHSILLRLQNLVRREPVETLEALCTQTDQWHGLYLATHDRKYLKHLSSRIDSIFSADLGL